MARSFQHSPEDDVVSLEDLAGPAAGSALSPSPCSEEEARRDRARHAARERTMQQALVYKLELNSRLYERWLREEGGLHSLIIRTPVPAVVERTKHGEPVFIQYARGNAQPDCAFCGTPCPRDGRKFLVVLSPRGLWCPTCAHKGGAMMLGDWGKQQRIAERRRTRARSSSSTVGKTTR